MHLLLLISTIKIENNNLFSHVWNNTAFVLQRIPSYLIGYYMAPSILKGKKVNLLKLTGIIAGCFLVIKIIFPANTFWEYMSEAESRSLPSSSSLAIRKQA